MKTSTTSDSIKEVQDAEIEAVRMLERVASWREGLLAKAHADAQKLLAGTEEEIKSLRAESSKVIDKEAGAVRKTLIAKAEREAAAASKKKLNKQKEKKAIEEAVWMALE